MDLKGIIKEQKEELERIEKEENIIPREGLEEARKYLKFPNILAVLGVRRCGKSIFSYLLAKNNKMGYINFDDERLIVLKGEELNKVLESFYELYEDVDYIILDEIQNIQNWELFINRLRRTKKVILTGSNSKILSGELSTHLTGRYIDFGLFPFSFKEFLLWKKFRTEKAYTTKEKAELLNLLREYIQIGGFPESYKFSKAILSRIYEDIITKDIILRYKINKVDELRKLSRYIITNSCEETTYSKLSRIFNIKHISTVSNWINALENSFLIFKIEKFDFKLKQQFISPKKIYCIDTGIINSIAFIFSENFGRLMENEVAIDLKRKAALDKTLGVYYWKDKQQNEIDFLIKHGKKIKQLIQVTYATSKEEIKEREIKSLIKASSELKCNELLVITWNYESEESIKHLSVKKKIKFIPLWRWLLQK